MVNITEEIRAAVEEEMAKDEYSSKSPSHVAWVLMSTALVLFMTPGLAFFYGGLVRKTNIINTLMMCLIAMGVVTVTWSTVGFTLAFGAEGQFIGDFRYIFLEGLDMKNWEGTNVPGLGFATFQMSFAIIAAAIISGSLVERIRFNAYVVFIFLWCLVVYVPLCHWVWGPGGWIAEMGALDFAGGTVVHISSGVSGMTAAWVLGKRKHKADKSEKAGIPANVPFVLLGAGILWFGWNGFNGGSALSVGKGIACRAVCTTNLAAASAMIAWVGIEWIVKGHPSSVGAMVGAIAGLVVITPAAGFVSPVSALLLGLMGAPICYLMIHLVNTALSVDDSLDAFGLHGSGGLAGALLTGFFALDGGLFYGGGWGLVWKQAAGAAAGVAWSCVGTLAIILPMKALMPLRQQEMSGMDELEHGEMAYSMTRSLSEVIRQASQVSRMESMKSVRDSDEDSSREGETSD